LRPSEGKWIHKRQLDGGLNRVPDIFYPSVYEVLRHAPEG